MSKSTVNVRATMLGLMLFGMAAAQWSWTSPASANNVSAPGQAHVADKFAAPFVTLAGSRENAVALTTALRTGSTATLTYPAISVDGTTTTTVIEITPATKPMGWGNVSHSLALAQFALNQQGIPNPTGAQLRTALEGGTTTTADGRSVTFAGVLQQRGDGMGFGRIAQTYGTTMGAVNRGIKAPATSDAMTIAGGRPSISQSITAANVASAPSPAAGRGVTTAAGTAAGTAQGAKGPNASAGVTIRGNPHGIVTASGGAHGNGNAHGRGVVTASGSSVTTGRGLTTAGGTAAGAGQGAKGLTTASGVSSRGTAHGVVTASGGAHGNGNAYGRGIVTASGSGAGTASSGGASIGASRSVVTGAGSVGHIATADSGRGAGPGNGHGKGKGGN